jgi:hypothetical protein
MKQRIQRWTRIGLMAVSVLTMSGILMWPSGENLASFAGPQPLLMADGGGDRPAPPPCPKGKVCVTEDALI